MTPTDPSSQTRGGRRLFGRRRSARRPRHDREGAQGDGAAGGPRIDQGHTSGEPRPETAVRKRHLPYRVRLGLLIAAAMGCGYLCQLGLQRIHLKRFAEVRKGVLYRSAQPSEDGFDQLLSRYEVNTVVCLRRENARLQHGLFDLGEPNGVHEDRFVKQRGRQHLHWPMGGRPPWFNGGQFEDFFRLMDDPANHPVAVHCVGGRHRTGTFVALYRMEYQRWPVERALREMYSFDFGQPLPVQEHNLRTYDPRPRPTEAQWKALCRVFATPLDRPPDYAILVRRLRQARGNPRIETILKTHIEQGWEFALPLAVRLIDTQDDPLARLACHSAMECIHRPSATPQDWLVASALVADFGDSHQQSTLRAILERESQGDEPLPRYQALVRGVTNRYTPNRLPYLRVLLDDLRPRPEPQAVSQIGERRERYRYCDTAVARLCPIVDRFGFLDPRGWEHCRQQFLQWFEEHPAATELVRLGEGEVSERSKDGSEGPDENR